MAVEATTTCKRVVGPVVAAALMVGAVGVTAAPAQAAQASGPADYASQAQKAADYIDSHQADLTKNKLGPQLDGALALVAAGRKDSPTIAKVKDTIKAQGPSYCTAKNVGGCAKVTITLLALGESTTYGGVDYAKPVTKASQFEEYATNQALDMIALERLGKPIPKALLDKVTKYATTTPQWDDPDTDGLTLTALSHVESPDKQKAVTSLVKRLDADKQDGAWGPKGQGPECEHHRVGGCWSGPGWRCWPQGAGCGRPEVAREAAADRRLVHGVREDSRREDDGDDTGDTGVAWSAVLRQHRDPSAP